MPGCTYLIASVFPWMWLICIGIMTIFSFPVFENEMNVERRHRTLISLDTLLHSKCLNFWCHECLDHQNSCTKEGFSALYNILYFYKKIQIICGEKSNNKFLTIKEAIGRRQIRYRVIKHLIITTDLTLITKSLTM